MKNKNFAIILMLFAGLVVAFSCLIFKVELVHSLLYTSITLFVFYFLGLLITKIVSNINSSIEESASELENTENDEKNVDLAEVFRDENDDTVVDNNSEENKSESGSEKKNDNNTEKQEKKENTENLAENKKTE